jgi:2-phospho-L-lactate guanylyltransferase
MQILLPLKEFAAAKQRLAGVLSSAERAQLFEAMVEDVLHVLTAHPSAGNIAICSRDQAARWLASYYGIEFIDEAKLLTCNLNETVYAASREVFARGENNLVVVHGDLPLLSANEFAEFLQTHNNRQASAVTIAPDRRASGTNLLAWRALPDFTTCYGENSFRRHCGQAKTLNVEPAICDLPGACCDIDEPEDLLRLLSQPSPPINAIKSLAFLRGSGIADRLLAMQHGANAGCGDDRESA